MKEEEKISFLNLVVSLLPDFFGLDVRHWIASQFALESNFGTSGFACCNNNFCGMKVPALRITLAVNSSDVGEFAQYGGITSCVHDYLLWLQAQKFYRRELSNLDLFRKHIDISGYCPDLGYMDKINSIYYQYYDRTK